MAAQQSEGADDRLGASFPDKFADFVRDTKRIAGGEMSEFDKVLAELLNHADKLGIDAIDLDVVIHDIKSAEAADINNGGIDSQIEFLLSRYRDVDIEKAKEQIKELLK